jgi:hypothetical protein
VPWEHEVGSSNLPAPIQIHEGAVPRVRNREKQRGYERAWYARHKVKAKEKVRNRKRKILEWFRAFKASLACIRCGENDPVTLDFHHRDPEEKDFGFNEIRYFGWSIKRLLGEIEKCDVLCANCHRKLHRDLRQQQS